jgi:hypothetical protein
MTLGSLCSFCAFFKYALVAQLDRVSVSEAEGRGFDSRRAHHLTVLPRLTPYTKPAKLLAVSGFFVLCRIFPSIAIVGALGA